MKNKTRYFRREYTISNQYQYKVLCYLLVLRNFEYILATCVNVRVMLIYIFRHIDRLNRSVLDFNGIYRIMDLINYFIYSIKELCVNTGIELEPTSFSRSIYKCAD